MTCHGNKKPLDKGVLPEVEVGGSVDDRNRYKVD